MSINEDQNGAPVEYTGRYLVVTPPHKAKELIASAKRAAGLSLTSSRDFDDQAISAEAMSEGDGIYLDEIGIAVISPTDGDQIGKMASLEMIRIENEDGPLIEPERMVYTLAEGFGDYLRGYRDAVNGVTEGYLASVELSDEDLLEDEEADATAGGATWGLKKTRVVTGLPFVQPWNGKGIKIAVLDTGMDLGHPDYSGRGIISRSFIANQAVHDVHGHGTHCTGTACGPEDPTNPAVDRYGVACGSQIFIGKVLSNSGSGADGGILAGINWAIAQGCHIISMSLGGRAGNAGYSAAYENAARIAMARGTLIIAAAGNDHGQPVSHPANCPSIMAVGAVGESLVRAPFSNITHFPPHGKVDIVGPGVGTFSSMPVAKGTYGVMSGTSMATPHVAGIAALHAQSNAAYRGGALWQRLVATAMPLQQPAGHVGAGLVQAPVRRISLHPIPIPFPPVLKPIPRPIPPLVAPATNGKSSPSRKA